MNLELIEAEKAHFPVDFMCQQLGVSRSGYYAWKERPESERHKADRALAEVVTGVIPARTSHPSSASQAPMFPRLRLP